MVQICLQIKDSTAVQVADWAGEYVSKYFRFVCISKFFTLAFDADILLMDEPFGALDEIVRDHLNEQLLKLWATTKKTIGFVTHSIPEAVFLSSKIVVMSPRPGRISKIINSNLPSDRTLEIRDSKEFLDIASQVRDELRKGSSDE